MKFLKKLLVLGTLALVGFSSVSSNNTTPSWNWSKCIELNTEIPWLSKNENWKTCVKVDKAWDAFWTIMWGLMKLMINFTVAIAFISLIAAGVMYSMSWVNQSVAGKWKDLLKKVILWIVLLGISGLILHTINPNFFTTNIDFVLIKKL